MGGDEVIQNIELPAAGVGMEEPAAAAAPAEAPVAAPAAAPAEAAAIVVALAADGLSAVQKAAVSAIIASMKESAAGILADQSALSVTVLLGKLVKAVEGLSISGAKLAGADKKAVVLEVGKQLISEVVPAEQRPIVLSIYELAAEPTLEAMVDVSRTLNVTGVGNAIATPSASVPAVSPAAAAGILSTCLSICMSAAKASK
jgi:hypothetical protein